MKSSRHLPAQVRAYRPMAKKPQTPYDRRWPQWVLVFDTETSTEYHQDLKFGCFRVATVKNDQGIVGVRTVIEGLFYDDDLPVNDPEGFRALQEYMTDSAGIRRNADVSRVAPSVEDETNGELLLTLCPSDLLLMSKSEFVKYYIKENGFTDIVRPNRDYEPCMISGFNLGFDLTRLAVDAGEAKGDWDYGGISLSLLPDGEFMPRVVMKRMGAKGVDIHPGSSLVKGKSKSKKSSSGDNEWTAPPAVFLDLANLVFALTSRNHSLRSAGEAFGCEHLKTVAAEGHGKITEEYIEYNRQDVKATLDLWRAAMERFIKHPINLPAERAYSTASIGKQYFRDMGIMGPLTRQEYVKASQVPGVKGPDQVKTPFMLKTDANSRARKATGSVLPGGQSKFDPTVLARFMGAFYGGRSETRIRMTPVPVTLLDFKSMYPTMVILFGIWEMLTSDCIEAEECDPTEIQALLDNLTINDLYNPAIWPTLAGCAEIQDDDDYLPYRSEYGQGHGVSPGIGINRITSELPMPYMLPDLAASKIHTGRAPRIVRAWKLTASPKKQPGIRPIDFNGDPELRIDPATDNLAKRVIELRQVAQNQHKRNRPTQAASETNTATLIVNSSTGHLNDCPDLCCAVSMNGPQDYVEKRVEYDSAIPCRNKQTRCYACTNYLQFEESMNGRLETGWAYDQAAGHIPSAQYLQSLQVEVTRVHANDIQTNNSLWNENADKCRCDGCVNQYSLKIFANACTYGIFAEMNIPRRARDNPTEGTVYGMGGQRWDKVKNPEEPGEFCFPPFAALITSGARLMLATLEKEVEIAGGHHVFCDTDSLCIASSPTGGETNGINLLTHDQVEAIRVKFNALNPYNPEVISQLLNQDWPKPEQIEKDQQVWCVAISAKRYCLYTLDSQGNPDIVDVSRLEDETSGATDPNMTIKKRSEHGLGLYLNPTGNRSYDWMAETWRYIITRHVLDREDAVKPEWFDYPAAMRLTITSWDVLRSFDKFNGDKPYSQQVKPWNFGLSFTPVTSSLPMKLNPDMRLIAPYETDLSKWRTLPIFTVSRTNPIEIRITTDPNGWTGEPWLGIQNGNLIPVKTYGMMIEDYVNHPEPKYDDANGNPCTGQTRGQLYPTRVIASEYQHISKSGKMSFNAAKTLDRAHHMIYNTDGPAREREFTRFILSECVKGKSMSHKDLLNRLRDGGVDWDQSSLSRFLTGVVLTPRPEVYDTLVRIARGIACKQLDSIGQLPQRRDDSVAVFSRWKTAKDKGWL
jgi:hypothetical protein